ncbi:4-(cytidine 5'-diphospho)-2-C-methyl-D-erythritol kinase [Geoalkalibacter halelectricus]|uniref:4-diphosphocytidyl-2-C-methyl-D-erythritol kinase n=1 Tax=Geoalkalibacter halelectricus TaxID=2847045 RepID=A0ABY5ZK18_9BACT|nr:4-(cytidine 5'-diphospho)-2-C-methyl-D-erythritol kinase [Geoalkalibacter halelectricus]MDO3377049.1 4-(cytidine 5'-diphospho)-2-C-methyl-D-erythritol kinase [Geoalkalibacter halelectricus]UWZ79497.1 4-(cytidine 5'-diphospho)-2-C-methyl-D-erythritol kinase [Geoalkalibacter halelectricus]
MTSEFDAPAKINLCLHVLGRRADGYHDLCMLMQKVSLADRISIALRDEPGVEVVCPGVPLAQGEQNIAGRAALAVLAAAGSNRGARIHVDKQIPVAAGLGGGSSDAATVLVGLNRMLGGPLSFDGLLGAGARLGADVPFFVYGRSAWAAGIGDHLRPAGPLPAVWYVLVNPGFAVSTAWVYGNLRLTSPVDVAKLPEFFDSPQDLAALLHNDLEQVTIGRYPQIAAIKEQLVALGALGALMSGSGPTVFGLFDDEALADAACATLKRRSQWRVFKVRPLEDFSPSSRPTC